MLTSTKILGLEDDTVGQISLVYEAVGLKVLV
jgi:hypothetical protein